MYATISYQTSNETRHTVGASTRAKAVEYMHQLKAKQDEGQVRWASMKVLTQPKAVKVQEPEQVLHDDETCTDDDCQYCQL